MRSVGRAFVERGRRLNDRRRIRCRRPRAVVRSSRHLHAQTEAEIGNPNAVRSTSRTGDIEAADRVDVAALPLEGKRGRVARPRALRRCELLSDTRFTADRPASVFVSGAALEPTMVGS